MATGSFTKSYVDLDIQQENGDDNEIVADNGKEGVVDKGEKRKNVVESSTTESTTSKQGCQYRTGGRTGLATGTIYFGYRSIPVYRFGFTAIFYIYIYIYIYICMYVCVSVYIYYNKYKSLQ